MSISSWWRLRAALLLALTPFVCATAPVARTSPGDPPALPFAAIPEESVVVQVDGPPWERAVRKAIEGEYALRIDLISGSETTEIGVRGGVQ